MRGSLASAISVSSVAISLATLSACDDGSAAPTVEATPEATGPKAKTDAKPEVKSDGESGAKPGEEQDAKTIGIKRDPFEGERHFASLTQLTFGGENAEAYWSSDETRLIFQSTRDGLKCDQIFSMAIDGSDVRRVSTGRGRTTCAYFMPGDERIVYASTHAAADDCLPEPDRSHGYVWKLYDEYDIYVANADGSDPVVLSASEGYDAEATVSPKGDRILFTSTRDGDPELYAMDLDGGNVTRLTNAKGYDGGGFFSADGSKIVWRANRPQGAEEEAKYDEIRAAGLVRPTRLELFVMNADGTGTKQITTDGAANFAPFMHPDGRRIIYASNVDDAKHRNFDLYIVGIDGGGRERVTHFGEFDGFPMFDRGGKRLVFASNRHHEQDGETNVFIADWVD
jgi:Tol biopolymer transport system component